MMNQNIKTSLEIYGIVNKRIEDTTNMAQSLKDINSEKWVSLPWLKEQIEDRMNSYKETDGDLSSLLCRIEMEEK